MRSACLPSAVTLRHPQRWRVVSAVRLISARSPSLLTSEHKVERGERGEAAHSAQPLVRDVVAAVEVEGGESGEAAHRTQCTNAYLRQKEMTSK